MIRRVLVVAASPMVRAGLSTLIATSPELQVIGNASDWNAIASQFQQLQPDVILLDLSSYPQESVWETLVTSQQQYPLAILAIADDIDGVQVEAALRAGVRGILPATSTESEITAATSAVADGLVVLHPDFVEPLLSLTESDQQQTVSLSPVQSLTPREIEVLEMLSSGLGNKAIAKRLHISEHTVKFHLSSIFQKLGVSTRTSAVAAAVRLGLILL